MTSKNKKTIAHEIASDDLIQWNKNHNTPSELMKALDDLSPNQLKTLAQDLIWKMVSVRNSRKRLDGKRAIFEARLRPAFITGIEPKATNLNITPGQWIVGKTDTTRNQTELRLVNPEGVDLHFGDIQGTTPEQSRINAHLAVAAPPMRKALKQMLFIFDRALPERSIGRTTCDEAIKAVGITEETT